MDVFDLAIEKFLDCYEEVKFDCRPEDEIGEIWGMGGEGLCRILSTDGLLSSLLFLYCAPDGDGTIPPQDRSLATSCGCLTQVRSGAAFAYLPEATARIQRDARLHNSTITLTDALATADNREERRKILEPYAEQQRWLRRLFADYEEEQEAAALCCERFDLPLFEE